MSKCDRVLILFYRLLMGERVKKSSFMEEFSVGRRSFDRYVASIRLMLSETFAPHELSYDASSNEYYLTGIKQAEFSGLHILPLLILLSETRALSESDTIEITKRLFISLSQRDRDNLSGIIREVGIKYESKVTNSLLKLIWDLNFVITNRKNIRLLYEENDEELQSATITPLKISYDNGNFILEAQNAEIRSTSPVIYPLYKIRSFEIVTF